mmetsp:Transcript_30225/g.86596  ORF Transcript_30225/g.86596 Transcript_30225/m.86596 type:complete len:217 (-) Transcript_30225:55-705(-)
MATSASDPKDLESTLVATFEVVRAQRAQLDALRRELAEERERASAEAAAATRAAEERDELRMELAQEREARTAAEARLRDAAVDFARRLSSMQGRVMEAERDVVLGCQVIALPRSAPPNIAGSSAGSASTGAASATWGGGDGGPWAACAAGAASDDAMFARPRVLRVGGSSGSSMLPRPPSGSGGGSSHRARSAQLRLQPLGQSPPQTGSAVGSSP